MSQDQRPPPTDVLSRLASGDIEIQGRMPWSSNGTFLVTAGDPHADGEALVAIYKPLRAERPLWDFPDGLYRREVAAYELDRALGWHLVPETVTRTDAPLGLGSLQRFIHADFEEHYFTLLEHERHSRSLRRMATFDVLANNADRKGGHCLVDAEGSIWGIDHGLCFHTQPKLRTVIWDFAGEPVDDETCADIARVLDAGLTPELREVLRADEQAALERRMRALLRRPILPEPRSDHPYPWPLI
ncbi:MAG: SCO1664 family protein [Acidimicrobiales bacterium]